MIGARLETRGGGHVEISRPALVATRVSHHHTARRRTRARARVGAVFFLLPRGGVGAPLLPRGDGAGGALARRAARQSVFNDPSCATPTHCCSRATTARRRRARRTSGSGRRTSASRVVPLFWFGWFARSRRTRPPYPTRAGEPVKKIEETKTLRSRRPML